MLSVNLGRKILDLVPGYVSTEVDIRLSFDSASSETRARRIIALYEVRGAWDRVPADALQVQTLSPSDALGCEGWLATGWQPAPLAVLWSSALMPASKGGCFITHVTRFACFALPLPNFRCCC